MSWIHLASEHSVFNEHSFFNEIFNKHHKTKSEPNEKYSYSNLGYVLLGQLIEKVSGMSYENYIKKHIINKLNLAESDLSFAIPDEANHAIGYHKKWSLSNFVLGFFIDKDEFMNGSILGWNTFKNFQVNGSAYGGLVGKPLAFIVYLQELIKNNSLIISDSIKKQLFEENTTNSGYKTGMCLSWFKGYLNKEEYYVHAGGGGGYYCEIRIYPNLRKGSVIFFNRSGMKDERILDKLDVYNL